MGAHYELFIFDFVGNVGVFLIIISYLLLQLNKLKSNDISYSAMNLIGAILCNYFPNRKF